jgi:hypothetical protein
MGIDVTAKISIKCPQKIVAAYAFDPANDPSWIGGIQEANIITGECVMLGTQVKRTAIFMGKTIEYVLEVTKFDTDHLIEMRSVKSPFPMVVRYQFDAISNDNTLAAITVRGSSKGFFRIADFLMALMVKNNIRRDVRRLKKIMEA